MQRSSQHNYSQSSLRNGLYKQLAITNHHKKAIDEIDSPTKSCNIIKTDIIKGIIKNVIKGIIKGVIRGTKKDIKNNFKIGINLA